MPQTGRNPILARRLRDLRRALIPVIITLFALAPNSSAFAPVRGPDVSNNNGCGISWGTLHSAGIRFAFAKATEGTGFRDRCFPGHWKQLAYYGFVRGAYDFAHLSNSPVAEAHVYLDWVKQAGGLKDSIAVLDVEAHPGSSIASNRAWVQAWVNTVFSEGHPGKILIYTAPFFWNPFLGCWHPQGAGLWVATYGPRPSIPCGWGGWDFWQFTDGLVGPQPHSLPGVGHSDISIFSGDLSTLLSYTVGPIPQVTFASRKIRLDTRGTDVRLVQKYLNKRLVSKWRHVTIDGVYGQKTETAKQRWECIRGFPHSRRRWSGIGVSAQSLLAHPKLIKWHRRPSAAC